ncbi:Cl- channel voltage-gated family protein [Hyphomicrobium denitrificans 1NES1]|uniref:Cl-channel voltage-gated family protein n=2 Tax=Hyphomicrobium denitrificans TaxID=53399 RepID=N0B5V9_9HYPH|nr:Cl- channel voltage-gated family protein [Hyphomicrobium denitrificans 1NES1]
MEEHTPSRQDSDARKRHRAKRRIILRRYRYVSLSRRVWMRRAVFIAGALFVGLTAVGFAQISNDAQDVYSAILKRSPFLPLFLTPLGFAALAFATARWFPAAAGSGIPQVIAARKSSDYTHRSALLGWQTTIAKIVMTALALVVGASVGREGPTVQVGASVMFAVATVAGLGRQNGFVLAGSAAGIAAAFNAPIAGILFAIEELAKAFAGRINDIVIGSVVIAGAVSWLILGNYNYFGEVTTNVVSGKDWLAVPICAVFGGVLGGLFSMSLVTISRKPFGIIAILKRHPIVFAGLCGLLVAVLSIATAGYASGNGYAETRASLVYGQAMPWWYGLAKLGSTLLSSASGIPGGLFSPSLAVGAGIGSMITPIFTFADPRAFMLLMTVGYFAGVVQAPLTAVVIVMEMTSDKNMVIPLMATALFAASLSRLIGSEPLYHALARGYYASAFRIHGTPDVSSAPKSVR